jgi:hypothetical protein
VRPKAIRADGGGDCEGSTGLPRPVDAHTSRYGCAVRSKFVGGVVREDGGRAGGEGVEGGSPRSRQRFRLLHSANAQVSQVRTQAKRRLAGGKSEEARCVVRPAAVPRANRAQGLEWG